MCEVCQTDTTSNSEFSCKLKHIENLMNKMNVNVDNEKNKDSTVVGVRRNDNSITVISPILVT